MKKIAVVTTSVALPGEKGLTRMHYLAKMLCNRGFYVELITSDFQHWLKSHRNKEILEQSGQVVYKDEATGGSLTYTFLHEDGYTKNIDIKRMASHYKFAKRVKEYLLSHDFDLVYADIPANRMARYCAESAKEKNIPYIVDVEDLWPEAMKMVINIPKISDILFSYWSKDAKKTYELASGVIGSSDRYRDEPLVYGVNIENKKTVYVGIDLEDFDEGVKENTKIQKPEGEFWVTYAGMLGSSYDIGTLIDTAELLKKQGHEDIVIKILGDGPKKAEWEEKAKSLESRVDFEGYQAYRDMAAYLGQSDITINSLVESAAQGIVSKIGDYLAAGIPMINTGLDKEFKEKVEKDGFGINVNPGNPEALAKAILEIKNNSDKSKEMGAKARKIAQEQFNRPKAFETIIEMITNLL